MTVESSSESADSIRGVAARINSWISLQAPGIIWSRFVSDVSRDSVLLLLGRPVPRIPFEPPKPDQAGEWLEQELRRHLDGDGLGVVAVLFPPVSAGNEQRFWESLRALNLRREAIAGLPLVQLWWIPIGFAARAESEAPDLASWFRLKLWLNERPSSFVHNADPLMLKGFHRDLPRETVNLRQLNVDVGRRLLASLDPTDLARRGQLLNSLSVDLTALGSREEALEAAQEALGLYQQLAQSDPDAFLPDLAGSLNNLANSLGDLGRREEALEAAQEALGLYQRLAQSNPDAFLPDLAMSLNNLAAMLRDLGRREEALAQAEEAVRLYRQLAAARPDAFLPDLASSLGAQGHVLAGVDRQADAVESFEEAIRLLTPFLQALPAAHAQLMRTLLQLYVQATQAAQAPPDTALLAPVMAVFEKLKQ